MVLMFRARNKEAVVRIPLLVVAVLAAGCASPSFQPTFKTLDETLQALQFDYERGYVVRLPDQPEKNKEYSAARVNLIKSARRNIKAALRGAHD